MPTASVCTKQIKYQSLLCYSRSGVLYELLSRSVLHSIPNNVKLMHLQTNSRLGPKYLYLFTYKI